MNSKPFPKIRGRRELAEYIKGCESDGEKIIGTAYYFAELYKSLFEELQEHGVSYEDFSVPMLNNAVLHAYELLLLGSAKEDRFPLVLLDGIDTLLRSCVCTMRVESPTLRLRAYVALTELEIMARIGRDIVPSNVSALDPDELRKLIIVELEKRLSQTTKEQSDG